LDCDFAFFTLIFDFFSAILCPENTAGEAEVVELKEIAFLYSVKGNIVPKLAGKLHYR